MPEALPVATIRTQVTVPLRFSDGYATTARVFTFEGWSTAGSTSRSASATGRRAGPAAAGGAAPLVRPHSECLTGDVFGSQRCDCGPQLREAVRADRRDRRFPALPAPGGPRHRPVRQARRVRAAGRRAGHLRGERRAGPRRGRARLHRRRADAGRAGRRPRIALLSNNPDKAAQLTRLGVDVTERVPTGVFLSPANADYLAAKAAKAGGQAARRRMRRGSYLPAPLP